MHRDVLEVKKIFAENIQTFRSQWNLLNMFPGTKSRETSGLEGKQN